MGDKYIFFGDGRVQKSDVTFLNCFFDTEFSQEDYDGRLKKFWEYRLKECVATNGGVYAKQMRPVSGTSFWGVVGTEIKIITNQSRDYINFVKNNKVISLYTFEEFIHKNIHAGYLWCASTLLSLFSLIQPHKALYPEIKVLNLNDVSFQSMIIPDVVNGISSQIEICNIFRGRVNFNFGYKHNLKEANIAKCIYFIPRYYNFVNTEIMHDTIYTYFDSHYATFNLNLNFTNCTFHNFTAILYRCVADVQNFQLVWNSDCEGGDIIAATQKELQDISEILSIQKCDDEVRELHITINDARIKLFDQDSLLVMKLMSMQKVINEPYKSDDTVKATEFPFSDITKHFFHVQDIPPHSNAALYCAGIKMLQNIIAPGQFFLPLYNNKVDTIHYDVGWLQFANTLIYQHENLSINPCFFSIIDNMNQSLGGTINTQQIYCFLVKLLQIPYDLALIILDYNYGEYKTKYLLLLGLAYKIATSDNPDSYKQELFAEPATQYNQNVTPCLPNDDIVSSHSDADSFCTIL